jgi:hypothetical protein
LNENLRAEKRGKTMKRFFAAALGICAMLLSTHTYAGERPFAPRGQAVIYAPVPVAFDAGRERIRQWQAELAAREMEIERAQTAWLPPHTVGPITANVVRDRSTFGDYFVAFRGPFVPTPTYVVDWRLAERRWFAYRPYPYPTAPVSWQPSYLIGYPQAAPDVVASPRVDREVVRSIGGPQTEVIGIQARRPPEADWR